MTEYSRERETRRRRKRESLARPVQNGEGNVTKTITEKVSLFTRKCIVVAKNCLAARLAGTGPFLPGHCRSQFRDSFLQGNKLTTVLLN